MSLRQRVCDEYFKWLSDMVCKQRYSQQISYERLLTRLHDIVFRYSIPKDQNRAEDGIGLRYRFADEWSNIEDVERYLRGPCSVLEMMIALAVRCEETIMDDPNVGDRTAQWFWGMIGNLGLGTMDDSRFDEERVDEAIDTLICREYAADGRGGLFTVRDCDCDMRDVEIWHQLCWYLDSIT